MVDVIISVKKLRVDTSLFLAQAKTGAGLQAGGVAWGQGGWAGFRLAYRLQLTELEG